MKVTLYKYSGENIRLDKTALLSGAVELSGYLKDDCSIIEPVIKIQYTADIIGYNYVYIEEFKRYYYIDNMIILTSLNLWEITLSVDVLMSFKEDILKQTAYVNRNEFEFNELLPDKTVTIQTGYVRNEVFGLLGANGNTFFDAFKHMDCVSALYVVKTYAGNMDDWSNENKYKPWYGANSEGVVGDYAFYGQNLIPTPNSVVSPYNNCNKVYGMCYNELYKLIQELDSFDFGEIIFGKKIDYILDIKLYPFVVVPEVSRIDIPLVVNGRFTTAKGSELSDTMPKGNPSTFRSSITPKHIEAFDRDMIFPNEKYKSYLGHSPYFKVQLYLPYYGIVDIDSELFIKYKYLDIDLAINYNDGTGTYMLYMENKQPSGNNYKQYFLTIDFKLGIDIPLGGTNLAEQINTGIFKSIQLAASVASGQFGITAGALSAMPKSQFRKKQPVMNKQVRAVANENIKQLASDTVGEVANEINQITIKPLGIDYQSNGFNSFCNWSCPKVITYSYEPNENPDNFASIVGKPLNAVKKLSDLHGFTSVVELHMENISNAIFDEIDEIEKILKSGVII